MSGRIRVEQVAERLGWDPKEIAKILEKINRLDKGCTKTMNNCIAFTDEPNGFDIEYRGARKATKQEVLESLEEPWSMVSGGNPDGPLGALKKTWPTGKPAE